MKKSYEQLIYNLRRDIEAAGARPAMIDAAINELMDKGNERIPSDLLSLLSDSAEYDEGMFSLIHAAESYDDEVYIRALLSIFSHLASSAPRWASIVLMRVLNSRSAQVEMVRQLRNAPILTKRDVNEICERINEVSPQFLEKTIPLILASS